MWRLYFTFKILSFIFFILGRSHKASLLYRSQPLIHNANTRRLSLSIVEINSRNQRWNSTLHGATAARTSYTIFLNISFSKSELNTSMSAHFTHAQYNIWLSHISERRTSAFVKKKDDDEKFELDPPDVCDYFPVESDIPVEFRKNKFSPD